VARLLADTSARLTEALNSVLLGPAEPTQPKALPQAAPPPEHAAHTVPTMPVTTPAGMVRLTIIAHALLDAIAVPAPARGTPVHDHAIGSTAENAGGDLNTVLDRHPAVADLVLPLLRELGLLAPEAEVLGTTIAQLQVLATVVLMEAEQAGVPLLNRRFMAECAAAGMPPFRLPLDASENIEAYRWLLIAVQLYSSARVARRYELLCCHRCGRTLTRDRTGQFSCAYCR